jgi:ferredoxin
MAKPNSETNQYVLVSADMDQDEQKQLSIIRASLKTTRHFFGGFGDLFHPVHDPRNPDFITYPLAALGFTGVWMFQCRLGARRQINYMFRGNGPSAAKFQALFDVESCPHGDTVNTLYSRLDPAEVQEVVSSMVETLIRKKVLYRYRLLDHYFMIAIDGTGRLTFPERHCAHCMTQTHNGKTTYYHPILEAKLVTANGLALSVMTEFIENPGEKPTKQDCELKAFYRLADRLKERFPRLPICLLLDGLFAGGPTFALCDKHHWKYLVVLTEDDLSSVHQELDALMPLAPENHLTVHTGIQSEIKQDFRWMNDISYVDSKKCEHILSVMECLETCPDSKGERKTTRFKWVTNLKVKTNNIRILTNQGGRLRWKIENEGFNVQKNGGYALEHAYSRDPTAAKVFYYMLQIAHILAQLTEYGSLFRKAFPAGVGSAKNIAFCLLEAWRNLRLRTGQLEQVLSARVQIRLDTS